MRLIGPIGFFAALASIAYGPVASAGSLDEGALSNMPVGKPAMFADLSSFDAQAVCILQPYQGRLSAGDALAARVNDYLAANNYAPDEGHFALVLIGTEAIEVAAFNRSRRLDVLARHEVSSPVAELLPKDFAPHDCASGQSAALLKIEMRERTYVLLGETR